MSSLEKYPSKSLFHFLNWVIRVFSFLLLSCRSYLCVLEINSLSDIRFHKYFLSFHGLPFILLFPLLCRSFLVWSPTYLFFILLSVLLMSFPKLISWGFPLILEVIYIFLILCWSFIWPGKSPGWRSLVGYHPWGRWVRGDWVTHVHFSLSCIGEGNGNPPSVLAWRIPGREPIRGVWWAAINGVTQSWTQLKWLSSSSRA